MIKSYAESSYVPSAATTQSVSLLKGEERGPQGKSTRRQDDRAIDAGECARLVTAYFTRKPDPTVPSQRVSFGTSGHRGSAFDGAFNEAQSWRSARRSVIPKAKRHRRAAVHRDRHARAVRARVRSALEVLAANGVERHGRRRGGYTPTPVISHAILTYNRGRKTRPR